MKDATGKEMKIGDTVVTMFDEYASLVICTIVDFTPQKVKLVLKEKTGSVAPITKIIMRDGKVRMKFPDQVAIV